MLRTGFANRAFPSTSGAARAYAEIAASRRRMGRPIPEADCQIAAIARSHGMAVATRNVGDFTDTGIEVIDPRKPSRLKFCDGLKLSSCYYEGLVEESEWILTTGGV